MAAVDAAAAAAAATDAPAERAAARAAAARVRLRVRARARVRVRVRGEHELEGRALGHALLRRPVELRRRHALAHAVLGGGLYAGVRGADEGV